MLRNAVKHLNTGPNAVNDAKIGVLEIAIRSNKLPPPFEMRGNQLVKVTDEGEQVVKITDAGLDAGPGQSGHVVTIRVMPIGAEN